MIARRGIAARLVVVALGALCGALVAAVLHMPDTAPEVGDA